MCVQQGGGIPQATGLGFGGEFHCRPASVIRRVSPAHVDAVPVLQPDLASRSSADVSWRSWARVPARSPGCWTGRTGPGLRGGAGLDVGTVPSAAGRRRQVGRSWRGARVFTCGAVPTRISPGDDGCRVGVVFGHAVAVEEQAGDQADGEEERRPPSTREQASRVRRGPGRAGPCRRTEVHHRPVLSVSPWVNADLWAEPHSRHVRPLFSRVEFTRRTRIPGHGRQMRTPYRNSCPGFPELGEPVTAVAGPRVVDAARPGRRPGRRATASGCTDVEGPM